MHAGDQVAPEYELHKGDYAEKATWEIIYRQVASLTDAELLGTVATTTPRVARRLKAVESAQQDLTARRGPRRPQLAVRRPPPRPEGTEEPLSYLLQVPDSARPGSQRRGGRLACGISSIGHAPAHRRRRADLVFTRARVAGFLDGCFWRGCPQHHSVAQTNAAFWADKVAVNRRRDDEFDAVLAGAGWLSIRIWEHDDPRTAALRIQDAVTGRRSDGRAT